MRYFYDAWREHPIVLPVGSVLIAFALGVWFVFSLINAYWTSMSTWKLLHIIFGFCTLACAPVYIGLTVMQGVRTIALWQLMTAYIVFNVLELMVFITQAPLLRDAVIFSVYGLNLQIFFGIWAVYTFATFVASLYFSFPHAHQRTSWQRLQMDWHVRNIAMLLFGVLMFSVLRTSKTVGNILFVVCFVALVLLAELIIWIANRYAPSAPPRGRDRTPKTPSKKMVKPKVKVETKSVQIKKGAKKEQEASYSYEYYTGTESSDLRPKRRGFF